MSILSKKKNVFEEVGVLKTASELSLNQVNLFSVFESSKTKNNKDPFLFMVDLLTILAGSDSVNSVITQTFSALDKMETSFKAKLKEELLAQNGGANPNAPIPDNLKTGFKVHINKLDFNRELFTKDSSREYNLYLDDTKKELIKAIKVPNKEVTLYKVLKVSYDNSTGFFTMKPADSNLSFKTFIGTLIDNIHFINSKILYTLALDMIFNTRKRKKEQIILDEQIDTLLSKIVVQEEEDDSYFEFNTEDLTALEFKLLNENKLYTEIGCGRVGTELTIEHVERIASGITFPVSKKVLQKTISKTSNLLFEATENINIKQNDKQSIRNSFLNRLLTALKSVLIRSFIASPQLNLIYALSQSFRNDVDASYNPLEDIKRRKALTKCMTKNIMNELLGAIFKLVKKEILELVSGVAVIYAKEAIEKYKKILLSIVQI